MSDIALQIERSIAGSVAVSGNVIFDTTVFTTGNIDYNDTIGVVTFNEPGLYLVNLWVSAQASTSTIGAVFELQSSLGDNIRGTSPIKTGEVSGAGIINVTTTPAILSLVNASGSAVYYSVTVPVKSSLVNKPLIVFHDTVK